MTGFHYYTMSLYFVPSTCLRRFCGSRRHKGISWLASITPQACSLLPPSSGAVLGVGCVVCVVVWSQPHHRLTSNGQLIPSTESITRHPSYITFSGAAFNHAESSFDVNPPQYTSFFKSQRSLSTFPIRAKYIHGSGRVYNN